MPISTLGLGLAASPAVCWQASGGLFSPDVSAAGPAAEPVPWSQTPPSASSLGPPKHPVPVLPAAQLQTRTALLHELSWDLTGDAPPSHPPSGLPDPPQLPSSIPQISPPPSRLPQASQLPSRLPQASQLPSSIPKMLPPPTQQQPPSARQTCQPCQDAGASYPSTSCILRPVRDCSPQPGRACIAPLWEGSPERLDVAAVLCAAPDAELAVLPKPNDEAASGPPRAWQHASSTANSSGDPAACPSSAHSPAATPLVQPVPGPTPQAPDEDSTQQQQQLTPDGQLQSMQAQLLRLQQQQCDVSQLTGSAAPPDHGCIDPWARSTDSLQYTDRPQVTDPGSSAAQRWSPIRAGGTLPAGAGLPAHESAEAATGERCCLDPACLSGCSDVQQPPHPGLHI